MNCLKERRWTSRMRRGNEDRFLSQKHLPLLASCLPLYWFDWLLPVRPSTSIHVNQHHDLLPVSLATKIEATKRTRGQEMMGTWEVTVRLTAQRFSLWDNESYSLYLSIRFYSVAKDASFFFFVFIFISWTDFVQFLWRRTRMSFVFPSSWLIVLREEKERRETRRDTSKTKDKASFLLQHHHRRRQVSTSKEKDDHKDEMKRRMSPLTRNEAEKGQCLSYEKSQPKSDTKQ